MVTSAICPNLLFQGACTASDCQYRHDVRFCTDCRVVCTTEATYRSHMNGNKHRSRIRAQKSPHPSYCKVCKVDLSSGLVYPQHTRGKRHQSLLLELAANPADSSSDDDDSDDGRDTPPGQTHCEICNTRIMSHLWSRHLTGMQHKKKEKYMALQAAFDEADKDKHGITLMTDDSAEVDFGFIELDSLGPSTSMHLKIDLLLNTRARIDIIDITLSSLKAVRPRPSSFSVEEMQLPHRLFPQKEYSFDLDFKPNNQPGRFYDRLEVVFLDTVLFRQFVITRPITAIVGSQADWAELRPTAPYKPKRKEKQEPEREVVSGVKPAQIADIKWVVPLPQATIPNGLAALLEKSNPNMIVAALKRTWLPQVLHAETYARHFHVLLHVEEAQMSIDIERYDERNVPMEPVHPYYRLPVPGLAEKRPSVIVGDRILVQNANSTNSGNSGHWFEGYVHRVRLNEVDLKFNPSFNSYRGQKYNIRFKLGRLPLRRMHQALSTAFVSERVLFPTQAHIVGRRPPPALKLERIRPVNKRIETNPPQLLAVATIINMPRGSVPFVLFGPPGTGKTVTIVEAINQILLNDPEARVLACAPSNSAADIIAERLKDRLRPSELFRMNAPSRDRKSMPKVLEPYARTNANESFSVPPLEELRKYRVIVSTCLSSSVPYGIGLEQGHFSHIFIDEAGQASEPEAMVPIMTMADNETNIILSGDPKQLGPIIRSSVANSLGLNVSYLDRLMARDIYDVTRGNGVSVVKLIKNWRSHDAILKYPNDQFYKAELEAHGDVVVTHSLLRSEEIVKPGFPLVFHAISGKDMREANSPSFFNPDEASLVKRYVERLRTDRRLRLEDSHIGVITPYHAQVMKIRTLLKNMYSGIKVGSVEEFQGQERRIIIISTVRSSIDFVEFDVKHTLGFVASPRRFNVAITRAQALLIVIGDPFVLSLDPLWRGFMNYMHIEGGWRGPSPDWDTYEPISFDVEYGQVRKEAADMDMEELIKRTRTLILENNEKLGTKEGEDEAQVDRPWRDLE